MNVTLQQVKSYPGNWKIYRKLAKEFVKEYDGNCFGKNATQQELLEYAKYDCDNGNLYWILLDNKRIGYALCPKAVGDQLYLDTRYIQKKYRGLGIGTRVLEILKRDYKCYSARILFDRLQSKRIHDSWTSLGFTTAVMCGIIDENFKYEVEHRVDNPHFFVLTEEYNNINELRSLVPYIDMKQEIYVDKQMELETA